MALLHAVACAVAATRWIGVSDVRIEADVAFVGLQRLAADGQLGQRPGWPGYSWPGHENSSRVLSRVAVDLVTPAADAFADVAAENPPALGGLSAGPGSKRRRDGKSVGVHGVLAGLRPPRTPPTCHDR